MSGLDFVAIPGTYLGPTYIVRSAVLYVRGIRGGGDRTAIGLGNGSTDSEVVTSLTPTQVVSLLRDEPVEVES